MSTGQPDIANIKRAVANALHEHWVLFLVEGVVLLVSARPPSPCRCWRRSRSPS